RTRRPPRERRKDRTFSSTIPPKNSTTPPSAPTRGRTTRRRRTARLRYLSGFSAASYDAARGPYRASSVAHELQRAVRAARRMPPLRRRPAHPTSIMRAIVFFVGLSFLACRAWSGNAADPDRLIDGLARTAPSSIGFVEARYSPLLR